MEYTLRVPDSSGRPKEKRLDEHLRKGSPRAIVRFEQAAAGQELGHVEGSRCFLRRRRCSGREVAAAIEGGREAGTDRRKVSAYDAEPSFFVSTCSAFSRHGWAKEVMGRTNG
jgi:hypothetical protein